MNARTRAIDLDLSDLGNPLGHNPLHWQALWVALVGTEWSTLAVVPVGHQSLAADVVARLVDTALAMKQQASIVTDALDVALGNERRLMPTASPLLFPEAALSARTADAVILVVALERDTVQQVQRVRDMIGAPLILGCLVAKRASKKDVVHGVVNKRADGNIQPANGVGAIARGPRKAVTTA